MKNYDDAPRFEKIPRQKREKKNKSGKKLRDHRRGGKR